MIFYSVIVEDPETKVERLEASFCDEQAALKLAASFPNCNRKIFKWEGIPDYTRYFGPDE